MSTFMPEGYLNLKQEKNYWNTSKMKEGDNRIRIVGKPIAGWMDWQGKVPMRYRPDQKPKVSFDPTKPAKAFWTLFAWDYVREGLYVLEISQASLIKALMAVSQDADWGDFTKYDIKINKQGSGKETRYTLTPLPPKPLNATIEEAIKNTPVRLEALFEGGDPWDDLEPLKVHKQTGEPIVIGRTKFEPEEGQIMSISTVFEPREKLQDILSSAGFDVSTLETYAQYLADKGKHTVEHIYATALEDKHTEMFKKSYAKWLATAAKEGEVN